MDDTSGSNRIIIHPGVLRRLFDAIGATDGANSSGQIRDVIDADELEPIEDTHNRLKDGPIVLRYAGWIE